MTAHAAGLFYQTVGLQYSCLHDLGEKHENGNKEFKEEGEVLDTQVTPFPRDLVNKSAYTLSRNLIISAPVIDHVGPPPDRNMFN